MNNEPRLSGKHWAKEKTHMKKEIATKKAQQNSNLWMILSLLFLIDSFLFSAHGYAQDTSAPKTAGGKCPYIHGTAKSGDPAASTAKSAGCPYAKKSKVCLRSLQKEIGLSDEQVEEIGKIKAQYQEEDQALRKKTGEQCAAMDQLLRTPEAKTKEIEKINRGIIKLKGEMKEKQLRSQLRLRAVLTPEQIRKLPPGSFKGLISPSCKGGCPKSGKKTCPRTSW